MTSLNKKEDIMNQNIIESLEKLDLYLKRNEYKGFDPYDALNSDKIKKLKNRWAKFFLTQFLVYSPINLRRFLDIQKELNPKAIGLILSAYCNLHKIGLVSKNDFEKITLNLVNFLLENYSKGFSGFCWGFNFDWLDIKRYAPKYTPTIVISSFIGQSFLDLFEITKNKKYLAISESVSKFLINDLNISEFPNGICFSYTPIDKLVVHNANCLGSAFLSRVFYFNKDDEILEYAKKSIEFSISSQKKDGSWAYLSNFNLNQRDRIQTDFHQGFIIDSICDFLHFTTNQNDEYYSCLKKAASFYMNQQFYHDGRAKWRLPFNYPIDIHHLSQGIITFTKMFNITKNQKYLDFSNKISEWTIENMQDQTGFFFYQKCPLFTNKIDYLRWGQAWMFYSLSTLLNTQNHCAKTSQRTNEN